MTRVDAYNYNLFAYPKGYFSERSAEELGLTEEERQELIRLQTEDKSDYYKKIREEKEKEFLEIFGE